jgi:hypothetical protein
VEKKGDEGKMPLKGSAVIATANKFASKCKAEVVDLKGRALLNRG